MSDKLPLLLYEATLNLYPTGADDLPLTDQPIWWGAQANGLRLGLEYEELLMASSGAKVASAHHLDERHTVEVERTWILPKADMLDFIPGRNQRYALEVVWSSHGYWYRRTYFGVTSRSASLDSFRTLHFGSKQAWRAEYMHHEGGYVPPPAGHSSPPPPIYTPLPRAATGDQQSVGFFRENVLITGEHLIGHYRWPMSVQLVSAKAIAFAPQVTPVVIGLEVNGAMVGGKILTLPVGTANTEVSDEQPLTVNVPAGQSVRWKVASGPGAPDDSAYVCAVVMQVQPL